MSVAVSAPLTVHFPSSDSPSLVTHPTPQSRPSHLPFRRISLPTLTAFKHRESVTSVASFDSLPEEGVLLPGTSKLPTAVVTKSGANAGRKVKGLSVSVEGARRASRRREPKPVDEAKELRKRRVVQEFYETEKAYVNGLDLIYLLFLTPIIESLDDPQPLLDRASLTSVFSNFIDIWNLHHSFLSSLSTLFSSTPSKTKSPSISPVLLSHFPYLPLYTPFITSFNHTITSLTNILSPSHPSYNSQFAQFLHRQESDPRCGKLKLRDWMLSIVQRCPRYLLLLKDLINCTDPEDAEYQQLTSVHALVSKITLSLNTSLHTHAQTLELLALQRSTTALPPNLLFISPGRALLRRGPLIMLDPRGDGRIREFLLFSDCLVWLENEAGLVAHTVVGLGWANANNSNGMRRTVVSRNRSKSEAELPDSRDHQTDTSSSNSNTTNLSSSTDAPEPPPKSAPPTRAPHIVLQPHIQRSFPGNVNRQASSSSSITPGSEDKWVFKGKAELVDLEVVIVGGVSDERRFEVLSPGGSFAVYAATDVERDEWSAAIRNAKASLLMSLNVTHPNSTLTSSASTNHLRRSLQALPFHPSDHRLDNGEDLSAQVKNGKNKEKGKSRSERRGRVEHWVPPIWIPDAKTEGCMRCGRGFNWRRRRHHCRLCGRCVCANCSGRTFYISDSHPKESTKPARACDACYETVFPLLDIPSDLEGDSATIPQSSSGPYMNTINSLTGFPSWLSMPSLPLPTSQNPEILMAIDREPRRSRALHRIDDGSESGRASIQREGSGTEIGANGRVRVKTAPARPRSSYEVFENIDYPKSVAEEDMEGTSDFHEANSLAIQSETNLSCQLSSSPPRREDTARKNKRFSMPAVALQTTSVLTRTAATGESDRGVRGKRFSLVLGRRVHGHGEESGRVKLDLSKSVAANRLNELLGRRKG